MFDIIGDLLGDMGKFVKKGKKAHKGIPCIHKLYSLYGAGEKIMIEEDLKLE